MGKKLNLETFLQKAITTHGERYTYSNVKYVNVDTKIIIDCRTHGPFQQTPYNHIKGNGCSKCHFENLSRIHSMGIKDFIKRAREVHGEKYNYSDSEYSNSKSNIKIICPEHGPFLQKPEVHLRGFGCSKCSNLCKLTTEAFINKANIIHNNKYDYSLTEYTNSRGMVKMICKKNNHGEFVQTANSHLAGNSCPKCMYKGQQLTGELLANYFPNTEIKSQYVIFIKNKKYLIDYYFILNGEEFFVEYDGPQHYEPIRFNGISPSKAKKLFKKQQKRDKLLNTYCKLHNINLIRIDSRKIFIDKIDFFLKSILPVSNSSSESFEISYGFEHIAIAQQKNICNSRLDVDIKSEIIKGVKINIPILASNMSTVINSEFYIKMYELGAFGILHRAESQDKILSEIDTVAKQCEWVAASIGIEENQLDFSKKMIKAGCNILVIDVAHGYTEKVFSLAKNIKNFSANTKIVIGNATNPNILYDCYKFADAVKVGIAQGLACETKNTAGCTEKQFSAVLKFKKLSKELGLPIISDGGIREPADFTKAIAAGANSVMAGSIFAACPESAAEIVIINEKEKKLYAGMASEYVQNKWKGGLKPGTCSEGGVRYLDVGPPVEKLIERYSGALKSGITYSGANNIESFQNNVKFILLK